LSHLKKFFILLISFFHLVVRIHYPNFKFFSFELALPIP